jgi:hypothetical protein
LVKNLGDDDAGLFALEFVGSGELAAEKFDEAAGARTAIGAEKAHAEEEDKEWEDFGILDGAEGWALRSVLFGFGEESGEGVVEFALNEGNRGLLIDDTGGEGFVGVGEGAKSRENIGIGGGGLAGAEFGDGESDGGEKAAVDLDGVRVDAHVEKGGVGGEGARMVVLVAMSGNEVGTVGGAVDGKFALGAATDRTDFFGLSGAKTAGFALLADWTSHDEIPWWTKFVSTAILRDLRGG